MFVRADKTRCLPQLGRCAGRVPMSPATPKSFLCGVLPDMLEPGIALWARPAGIQVVVATRPF